MSTIKELESKFMEEVKNINDKLNQLALDVASLPEKILEKTDSRYASKNVEKAVYGFLGAVFLAVFYAVFELIKK